jgi:hypothetical protein
MAGFFKRLKEELFGKSPTPKGEEEDSVSGYDVSKDVAVSGASVTSKSGRDAYFVQIGLDFGTAFCKCVCRDVTVGDRAWVHLPDQAANAALPFLTSSSLSFSKGMLGHSRGASGDYTADGLAHIKMALEKVALKRWDDPVLIAFKGKAAAAGDVPLAEFVEGCAVYLLAGILGGVRKDIAGRFAGNIEGDYQAVNMAVPVANAEDPKVSELFNRVLRLAWVLADEFRGFPASPWPFVSGKIAAAKERADSTATREACFVYPEVSANVQCFVRSRTSSEGIYLFSDTGAGTVDQSVFIFLRTPGGAEQLTYLHANVFSLGSSQIERLAAEVDGDSSWTALENWRSRKEAGASETALVQAKNRIGSELATGTNLTICDAKRKLIRKPQINDLRVLFGGGGHTDVPYARSVTKQFDGGLFHPDAVTARRNRRETFEIGLPIPSDLGLTADQQTWMNRLTVAYGLSFERGDLSDFRFPCDVEPPNPDQVWKPQRGSNHAPSKDEV